MRERAYLFGILTAFGVVGLEVSEADFESPQSIVFDQVEIHIYKIEAILVAAIAA